VFLRCKTKVIGEGENNFFRVGNCLLVSQIGKADFFVYSKGNLRGRSFFLFLSFGEKENDKIVGYLRFRLFQ
jgi:hypothetical protein